MFRSGHAGGGLGIASGVPGFGGGAGDTVVNNYYGDSGASGGNSGVDAQQDANDFNLDSTPSNQQADWSQDANQDVDDSQDLADYDVNDDDGLS